MDAIERIKSQLASAPVVLYMKGTPDFPQCGFSAQTVGALKACKAQFASFNKLDNLCYSLDKQLAENKDKLDAADASAIEALVKEAREALERQDDEKIQSVSTRLEQKAHELASKLYANTAGAAGAPGQAPGAPEPAAGKGDVVDNTGIGFLLLAGLRNIDQMNHRFAFAVHPGPRKREVGPVALFEIERIEKRGWLFFLLALGPVQPIRRQVAHNLGYFPPHVELADTVRIVLLAGFVQRLRRRSARCLRFARCALRQQRASGDGKHRQTEDNSAFSEHDDGLYNT